jgi:hypothetical protein
MSPLIRHILPKTTYRLGGRGGNIWIIKGVGLFWQTSKRFSKGLSFSFYANFFIFFLVMLEISILDFRKENKINKIKLIKVFSLFSIEIGLRSKLFSIDNEKKNQFDYIYFGI